MQDYYANRRFASFSHLGCGKTAPMPPVGAQQSHRAPRTYQAAPVRRPYGRTLAKAAFVLVALIVAGVVAYYGTRGYALYEEALEAKSIEQMVASVQASPTYVSIEQVPDVYALAVVAVEDRRFYRHPGFDIIATARALANDVMAGSIVEGGSTITQQLAKNQFFTQEQTIERKVAEVFMALDIERHLSKSEILELYVNSIYFGEGYYGVYQASQGYFGKEPWQLDDYESTLLAGIPNAPSVYAPTVNPELAAQRQGQVLEKMEECQLITSGQADAIRAKNA